MTGPPVRYPPPVLFVAGIVAGWWLDRAWPMPLVRPDARWIEALAGWLLVVLGAGLTGWAVATFRSSRTTIIPNRPASTLVTLGPYRLSRNAMYMGLSLVYLGAALLVNSLWTLLLFPVVIAVLQLTVIRLEERYLSTAFGTVYDDYRRRVRRWL